MGKSKATPKPSVSEVTVMMTTAAISCQRAIRNKLEIYCRKLLLEEAPEASAARVLCPWGVAVDSVGDSGMVQTIAEARWAGDCQHGHRRSVTKRSGLGVGCANRSWVPHISLVFREMWDSTNLTLTAHCVFKA